MTIRRRHALAGALAMPFGTAKAATTWRIVTEYPATAIPGEGVAFFAEAASRLSAGALVVQPGFEAMRSATMIQAVVDDRIDAADAFTGALAGESPVYQLSALPFLTTSTADTARLLAAARPYYVAALGSRGLSLLYATPWPASGIWSRTPLAGPDALIGLRIRTYDAASTAVMKNAGAAPVQISFVDAMPRLRAGEMDAVLSSGDGGAGARLWEILPNFTVIDYASPLSLAFCRTTFLKMLPTETQQAVLQAAKDTEARQFTAMATRLGENEGRMRANGVAIAAVPALRSALVAAASVVLADWGRRAGPDGEAILAAFRS